MRIIRVGTRKSELALKQARLIFDSIERLRPDLRGELVPIVSAGDRQLDKPLDAAGGKGLFVKELEDVLARGEVDVCVHSYKDMPVPGNPDLPVAAVSAREDPRDVLILPSGRTEPNPELPLGSSSRRRAAQLASLYPGWLVKPIRGNVSTRLRQLDAGSFGGIVLAAAGLKRLGLWDRVGRVFSVEEMLPAACQGILALQVRRGYDCDYLARINDPDAWDASLAERSFIQALEGGCSAPCAAFAQIMGGELELSGLWADASGILCRAAITGPRTAAADLGRRLADRLRTGG